MAVTRLSDIIEPDVFTAYTQQLTTRLDALLSSGIVVTSSEFDARANGAGDVTDMPFWNDLGETNSNIGTDDPAVTSTPLNIDTGKMIALRNHRNQSWGAMDLLARVAGQDPMDVIAQRVAKYWVGDRQRLLISMLKGLEADNIAANSSDMVHDVGTDSASAITDAEKLTSDTVLEAKQTMGDAARALSVIVMHSRVHTNIQKAQKIDFVPAAETNVGFDTYLGYRVIVDDNCPVTVGTNRSEYTSYLFGPGVFALGNGTPKVPTEVWRDPASGRGSGEERLYSRQQFILHPLGFQCSAATSTGKSPTNSEYEVAGAWSRVYNRKKIPLVILKTNE